MMRILAFILMVFISISLQADNEKKRELTMREFIKISAAADPEFQSILIEQYYLKYKKDLELPASDLVLSLTGQYDLFLDQKEKNGAEGSISLSKLFPATGTEISA
jgi:hypothetical protein